MIMRESRRSIFTPASAIRNQEGEMKSYMCVVCGFVYDEEQGLPDEGIPPGTKWEDVPETWKCPECGASKDEFEMIEI
jgi:rubredoxin